MEGDRSSPTMRGINYRTLAELFMIIGSRAPDWQFSVAVSVIEIYNENMYDLLSDSGNPRDVKLRFVSLHTRLLFTHHLAF